MKKMKILVIVFLMFVFSTNIFALCEDNYLMNLVKDFEINIFEDIDAYVNYPELDEPVIEPAQYAYVLTFQPVSNDFVIRASYDGKSKFATYSYKYDAFIVGFSAHYEPRKYLIEVYGREGTSCSNERLLAKYYTVPAFNELSNSEYCEKHKDEEVCKIYYDSSKLTEKEKKEILKEQDENESPAGTNTSFIKKTLPFFAVPLLLISLFYSIKITRYKKKESNR